MPNTWKDMDTEQLGAAPPSTCRYCGEPIYWESLPRGKLQPVDATDLRKRHYCMRATTQAPRKEIQMLTSDQAPLFTETLAEKKVPTLNRTETHTQYKLADGTPVPGVTTILGILNKPALVHWAWELGRQNLDYREVRDNAADIGTLAHYLIMCHLKGETPDAPGYSAEDIKKVNTCVAKFKNWLKEHPISPVMMEEALVSEEFKFGGTLDLFAELDGEFVLVDFKTGSSGIFPEMMYQLAAYRRLLEEQGWPVASARILRMSRDGDDFEEKIRKDLSKEFEIFKHCLSVYQLQRGAPDNA